MWYLASLELCFFHLISVKKLSKLCKRAAFERSTQSPVRGQAAQIHYEAPRISCFTSIFMTYTMGKLVISCSGS